MQLIHKILIQHHLDLNSLLYKPYPATFYVILAVSSNSTFFAMELFWKNYPSSVC